MSNIRDHLWLWAHQEGSHNGQYGLPADSAITPAEGAQYLGLSNVIMVCYRGQPEPPFDGYAQSLQSLDRVVWSIVGDAGSTRNDEKSDLEEVITLAARQSNITGGIMDDFFTPPGSPKLSRYDLPQIAEFRDRLHSAARPLDLWVVLYDHQLDMPVQEHLKLCDVVTFWTWTASELSNLETNFAHAETLIDDRKKVLGCYMWDYGAAQPIPLELMRYQCETGLQWLRQGRINGLIFLASNLCDLDVEAVEWTRDWIARVGNNPL